ncbi:MAG: YicC/YloC family endoribonuclease [Chitinophagales bacterium]
MLLSMTGFGKSKVSLSGKNYTIEIKSLNSKSLDLNFKAAAELRDKEIEIRKLISDTIIRGKADLFLQEEKSSINATALNFTLIENYYQQIKQFTDEKDIPIGNDVLSTILRFQDIAKPEMNELTEDDYLQLKNGIETALTNLMKFRKDEGAQLEKDILEKIANIQQLKTAIEPFESRRIEKVREKLEADIAKLVQQENIDKNRLEQEIIFYLEKMDINEEKVRLDTHCNYFIEMVQQNSIEKGKKLGFIAQEIGREINTIGSKANDVDIQKCVIQMKDELEKIKEQLMNIL